MKGTIREDRIPVNKYQLLIVGMPPIVLTEVSGIEDELETADLPDRTVATGGNRKSVEFSVTQPMHHTIERLAMEVWYREGQDPVSPTYKKPATLAHLSNTGNTIATYELTGMFLSKRKLPDLDMNNEGEMASIEWTCKADDVLPLS